MDPIAIVAAGLIGAAVLAGLMFLAPWLGLPKLDMVQLVGSLLTSSKTGAYVIGTVIHFTMGVLFAFLYVGLWSMGLGNPTWSWGLIYGAIHGVISLISLPAILQIHPRPPRILPTVGLILGMILGHLIYGIVVAVTYTTVAPRV